MKTTLEALLKSHEDELKRAWSERVKSSSRRYARRPAEEIESSVGHALSAVTACIAGRGAAAITDYASRLARQRLDEGIPQVETVSNFLMGRELVLDLVHDTLPPDQFLDAAHRVNEAFHRVIASYGSSFCSMCTARQDERRHHLQRHLESLIERSQDAMILFDEERRIQAWNAGAQALLGCRAAEALGQSLDRFVPEDRRSEMDAVWADLRRGEHVRLAETRVRRTDGAEVWVDAAYTSVRAEGTSLGTWAVFRDITGAKTLHEEKLQSERLALVGTMSAKLAHEVRNPLNSLVLGLDLVRDDLQVIKTEGDSKAGEALEILSSVDDELHRIQRTVEHYLRFAHLPQVQLEPLRLDALLSDHFELLRPDLQQKSITLSVHLQAGDAKIQADSSQLWQAMLNLVRNAEEAMLAGGTLTVTTRERGDRVECVVEDTGIGMKPEARAQLYRPFFSTKTGGTGLGMALARQILQEHGATIECESEPGQGTRFTLSIPKATSKTHKKGAP